MSLSLRASSVSSLAVRSLTRVSDSSDCSRSCSTRSSEHARFSASHLHGRKAERVSAWARVGGEGRGVK